MWVNFKANIYELKKEILSDTNVLPKEFRRFYRMISLYTAKEIKLKILLLLKTHTHRGQIL